MNCIICAEKFTKLKDLIRHGIHRHKYSHFFCWPCALEFDSVTDVVDHVVSDEHFVMALATSVRFDTDDRKTDTSSSLFPPHAFCMLCGYRGFRPIDEHIKDFGHKDMARVMRTIIRSKKIHCFHRETDARTQVLISKIINVRHVKSLRSIHASETTKVCHGPLPFICELCNIHFSEPQYYTQHLENESHIRMEQFLKELSLIVKEIDIIGAETRTKVSKTFSNSFTPLYCEECGLWCKTLFNYTEHMKSNSHSKSKRTGDANTFHYIIAENNAYFNKPNPKAKKRRQQLEPKKRKELERCYLKDKNMVGDCCGKNTTKMLKTFSFALNYDCRFDARKSHSEISTPPELEASDTSSNSSVHGFRSDESDSSDDSGVDNISNPQEHYCEVCDFLSYSSLHYQKHLFGRYHRIMKRMVEKKEREASTDKQASETSSHPLQLNGGAVEDHANDANPT